MRKVDNRWSRESCLRDEGCDEDGPMCLPPNFSNYHYFVSLVLSYLPLYLLFGCTVSPHGVSFVSIWVCFWQIPLVLFNMASWLPPVIQLIVIPQRQRLTLTHLGSGPGLSQGIPCKPALALLPASHSYQLACTSLPVPRMWIFPFPLHP